MNIKIISDSTCDLSPELLAKYNVSLVPLTVIKADFCLYSTKLLLLFSTKKHPLLCVLHHFFASNFAGIATKRADSNILSARYTILA